MTDVEQAKQWVTAAEKEHTNEDFPKFFFWAYKAAEAGNCDGAFLVAIAYMNGQGVEQNKELALTWLDRAISTTSPSGSAYRLLANGMLNGNLISRENALMPDEDRAELIISYLLYAIECGCYPAIDDVEHWAKQQPPGIALKTRLFRFYSEVLMEKINPETRKKASEAQRALGNPIKFLN